MFPGSPIALGLLACVGGCFDPSTRSGDSKGSDTGGTGLASTTAVEASEAGATAPPGTDGGDSMTSRGEVSSGSDGSDGSSDSSAGAACTAPCQNGGLCTEVGAASSCNCTGTGFDGEFCGEDIDECAATEPLCSAYATCTNEPGSFTCECGEFASGDPYEPAGCCPEQSRFECGQLGAFGPCEPFATSGDELVRDTGTNLVWARVPELAALNWTQGGLACAGRGMRVPTVAELEGIVDSLYVPTWMPCVFDSGPSDSFWTATEVGVSSAFVVHFSFGGTGNTVQQNDNAVRCVQ